MGHSGKHFIDPSHLLLSLVPFSLIDLALSLFLTSLPISMKFFAPDVLNTPRNYLTFTQNKPGWVFRLMDDVWLTDQLITLQQKRCVPRNPHSLAFGSFCQNKELQLSCERHTFYQQTVITLLKYIQYK